MPIAGRGGGAALRPDVGRGLALAPVAALLVALAVLGSLGGPLGPAQALAVVVVECVRAGAAPAIYLCSAWGLGRLGDRLWPSSPERGLFRMGLGLALLLSLSHLLGILGLLTPVAAWLVLAPGLALGAHALARGGVQGRAGRETRPSPWPLLWVVPAAVLLVAAANPPGWLWESEFGGYDALSYHLRLPQEWLSGGRVWPLEHNVYSHLPGYLEVAFYHLAQMTFAPAPAAGAGEPLGLLAGDGWRALMPQMLHAQVTILAAWGVRRVVMRMAELSGLGREEAEAPSARAVDLAGWIAGALVLATPWVVVVGSLAYNEMAVALLACAALLAAVEPGLRPWARGLVCGMMMGGAASVKPTGLFVLGPVVGLAMVWSVWDVGSKVASVGSRVGGPGSGEGAGSGVEGRGSRSDWNPVPSVLVALAIGAVAGAVTLAPWLVRNELAAGNPVFPQAVELFGAGHWNDEQAERWAAGHRFEGGVGERLALAPGGGRGLLHAQWFAFWPTVALAGALALRSRRTRGMGLVLAIGLAGGLVAWLALTHVQSRFLVPLVAPGAALVGLAVANAGRARDASEGPAPVRGGAPTGERGAGGPNNARRSAAKIAARPGRDPGRWHGWLGVVLVVVQSGALLSIFAQQARGGPNLWLGAGPHAPAMSGLAVRAELEESPPRLRRQMLESLPPVAFANLTLPRDELVYLVGDATPFYLREPVLWHTTWDASPLGELMRERPEEPGAWTDALRERGVRWVLVNFAEIERLQASGWHDPLVTPQRVGEWIEESGELVRTWPADAPRGRAWAGLYRLRERGGAS